jgi:DNA-binding XRE family transcriptional regulator
LPFCYLIIKARIRPYPYRWKCTQVLPKEPKTLGDHIKRRRLELHLFQSDLAKRFGVDIMTIGNWEKNVYPPAKWFIASITAWLGYPIPRGG